MNLLRIYPRFPETFWSVTYALRFIKDTSSFPPLGLLTVAALEEISKNKGNAYDPVVVDACLEVFTKAEKILGYAPAELQTLRLEQFLTSPSYLRVMKAIQGGLLSGREGKNTNTVTVTEAPEFVHRSGSTLRCDVRAGFLSDAEGYPPGIVGITRDIEDRKRAERADDDLTKPLNPK